MHLASLVVTGLVAALHLYFFALEAVFWQQPLGLKTFNMDPAKAKVTAELAKNQGLYNGFLAAGLAWSIVHPNGAVGVQLQYFFLGCVVVAGVFGAATVNKRIFFIQAVPALVGLALAALS
jgi:putative membrane protein